MLHKAHRHFLTDTIVFCFLLYNTIFRLSSLILHFHSRITYWVLFWMKNRHYGGKNNEIFLFALYFSLNTCQRKYYNSVHLLFQSFFFITSFAWKLFSVLYNFHRIGISGDHLERARLNIYYNSIWLPLLYLFSSTRSLLFFSFIIIIFLLCVFFHFYFSMFLFHLLSGFFWHFTFNIVHYSL